jgi:hypothetical protein
MHTYRRLITVAILLTMTACGDRGGPSRERVAVDAAAGDDAAELDACTCVTANNVADIACVGRLGLSNGMCIELRCPQTDGEIWRAQACAPPERR